MHMGQQGRACLLNCILMSHLSNTQSHSAFAATALIAASSAAAPPSDWGLCQTRPALRAASCPSGLGMPSSRQYSPSACMASSLCAHTPWQTCYNCLYELCCILGYASKPNTSQLSNATRQETFLQTSSPSESRSTYRDFLRHFAPCSPSILMLAWCTHVKNQLWYLCSRAETAQTTDTSK